DSAAEFVAQTDTQGSYGKFSIGTDGTWTYATDTNMNSLAEGETVTETFTVRSADGTETTVTVNITGTNDAAVVSSDTVNLTESDTILTTGGVLSITDVDSAAEFVAQTDTQGTYGKFSIGTDGTWTYVTDTNMNSLAEGETVTETFTVRSADGTETTVTVNITGTNDAAVVSSDVKDLTETNAILTTGGVLSITDIDSAAEFVAQTDTQGSYGKFSIDAEGNWKFTTSSAFNELNVGDSYTETFKVAAADGTETSVTVKINGTNDAPEIHEVGISAVENKAGSGVSLLAIDPDSTDLTFAISEGQDLPVGFKFDSATNMVSIDASTGYDYLEKGQKETFRVEYTVTDSEGATSVSYVNITVTGSADKPVVEVDNNVSDVTFVSDGAGYTNALGIYTTDEDGNPVAGELILLNSDKAAVNELLATYQGEDVQFFIVTNVGSDFAGGEVSFSIGADGNPTLLLDGTATGKNVFYSDESLNADGIDHFVTNADGSIGIEDLFYGTGGYDGDFNDLVINVTERPMVYTENDGPVYVFSNMNVTDVDSTEAKQMKVYMDAFYSAEDKITVDESKLPEGITYTISNGTVTFTSTEALPFSVYEEAAKAVMYENTSETPRTDDRVFNIRVMDSSGLYSDPVSVSMKVVDVVETYEPPVAVDDSAAVTEVNDVDITGLAFVSKEVVSSGENEDISPSSMGFGEARVIVPDPNNQNATVGGEYVLINSVSSNFALSNTSNTSSYIEIGDVARGIQVNVNLSGGNDVVYLSGTNSGSVNINGGEMSGGNDHDIVVLPGSASDYTFVVNGNVVEIGSGDLTAYNSNISVYSKDGTFTGTIVLNNIEEVRFGGVSTGSYEYVVDVETSQALTDDGYVVLSVVDGILSAGTDNGDGTWTVAAEDIDGLLITPTGTTDPQVAVVDVVDSGYSADLSASIATGNLITGTGADYDSDTSTSNLFISSVEGTAVASTGETAVKGEYGTLYIKEDGSYRYELDNDSSELDTVNKGDTITEDFTYTLSDGTSTDEAVLTVTINGADDVSVSTGNLVISEGHTSVPVANLLFMIDVSGSMGDTITSEGDSRLDVLKQALSELIDKYDEKGDIGGIQIIIFSTDATSKTVSGSVWLTVDQAKSILNSLNDNGYTDYDDALSKLMTTYSSSTAPEADYTHAYFVSDGAPSSEDYKINSTELTQWRAWLGETDIDEVYSVGIGSGTDSQQLQIVAWSSDGEGYLDNVLVVPDDTLNADISAAAEQNSRESSVFNDVDIPANLTANLTAVYYAGHEYSFSDTDQQTISLGENGSLVINSDGTYVFTAGTDVDADITSLLQYKFEVNGEDYAGSLSLTTNHIVDSVGDFSIAASGTVYESTSGYGVGNNGVGKGESLTFNFDSDDVTSAKFEISGTVKSGSGYTVYDTEGHSTYYSMPTSGGEIVVTSESGISHVVFNGSSSSAYYVQPVSAEATADNDNVFAVFGDANSNDLDFSGLQDLDAIQMNNDSKEQTVTLTASDVLSISDTDTHTLQISGGEGDKLVLSGDWKAVGNNTYCADINGNEVCIEVNNDDHKLKVFTDDGNQIG
uniref:VCBS domain-containing protein n=1 Tax=Seleniivibrio woodruffii TaxID=1078050 RepID=UPI0026E936C8